MYMVLCGQGLSYRIVPARGGFPGMFPSVLLASQPSETTLVSGTARREGVEAAKPLEAETLRTRCSVGYSKSQGQFGFRWRVRKTPALAGRRGQATRWPSVCPGREEV